jgi:hypothetical protein
MKKTPDELEQQPAPMVCRTCGHWVQFVSMDGSERQLCGKMKPQHEGCKWSIPRTPGIGGKRHATP